MEHPEDESRSGGERHDIQDDEEAVVHIKEFKKSVEYKMTLRQSNLNSTPDPNFLRTLESSIKRNTAIIKKLKQINEGQRESLMDELQSVNLTKFVSEAVTAICDAKLRTSDIPAAVQICSLLHQWYKDFSPSLVKGLLKSFYPGKSEEEPDAADKNLQATKKRSSLKLLLELYYVGVLEDEGILVNLIKDLTSVDHLKDQEDAAQTNLPFLASFARQARHLLGLPQPGHEILEEGLNIAEDQKKFFSEAFHTYYYAVAELLHSNHTLLRQMEHENSKSLNVKGELSEEDAAAYVKLRKSYDRLYRGVWSLAEALDMQPPVIPEDGHTTRVNTGEDASSSPGTGKNPCIVEAIWDDEDTRTFYECLPDLRTFVPAVLFGESGAKVNDQSLKTQSSLAKDLAPEPDQQMLTQDTAKASTAGSGDLQDGEKEKGKGKYGKDKEMTKDLEKGKEKQTDRKGTAQKKKLKNGLKGTNFDGLLHRLPGCVSRDLIDQLTIEFCYMNSKSKRKKLVRALFNVPRTSLELLAYYSRMVATLSTCMKDVSLMLLQLLEEEFNFLINKKDQLNIETKIRNIRFIGELCKFKIAPAGLVFSCLKACLDDFTHHNVDVACNLLETCGRFLYRSPETSIRMANMLEILMRLKKVKILDPHHSTLVDNAYYLCKPPERSGRISKVRPPLHQYIRKLLFSDLDKSSIEHVQTQLCKLPWSECGPYILKCFMKVHRGNYGQIHLIASLTAGLSQYHDEFAVSVVDEVLEEIRVGLELNNNGMQQRRISHMRFLGELYNYKHVDSSVIFDTLYLILVFGHATAQEDVLDHPEDCFRIRLVITLLETCGHHFDRGSSMRKLDQFLIHFQRYILSKVAVPLDIEFDLQDLFANLRPNMIRYSSIEEVNAALFVLEEHDSIVSIYKANNSEDYEEVIKESDSYSGTSTIHAEEQFDEREVDEENHIDAHDSKYDEVRVGEKVKEVDLEAAEFEREFRALIQESLDSRKLELRARPTLDMMIPMNVFDGPTKDYQGVEGESGDKTSEEEGGEKSKEVRVKVLIKRGSKQRTKQMFIPRDCSLVHDTKQKEAAELEEKQDIKRLVLEYNERKEEEELNALGITLPTSLIQSGDGRVPSPGHTWQGHRQRGAGSRFRYFHHHSGAGHYYSRRR